MTKEFDIVITTNGPGEIVSWVTPVVRDLSVVLPEARIIVLLMPCRFASGNEADYLGKNPHIDLVLAPSQTKRFFWSRRLPDGSRAAKDGVVIFLGGDLVWAYFFKKRLGYRAIAYTEGITTLRDRFDNFFLRDNDGDLMVDAFAHLKTKLSLDKVTRVMFFPGSRPGHFEHLIPFYKEVAKILKKFGIESCIGVSPFIRDDVIQKIHTRIELSSFRKIIKGSPAEIFSETDLLVTIPGTNTAQAAIAGIPFITLLPVNQPEQIHFNGLAGALGNIPVVGKMVKRGIVRMLMKRRQFYAIPNIKAAKKLVPELVGVLEPDVVARLILDYTRDTETMVKNIREAKRVMGAGGVSKKIAYAIQALMEKEAAA